MCNCEKSRPFTMKFFKISVRTLALAFFFGGICGVYALIFICSSIQFFGQMAQACSWKGTWEWGWCYSERFECGDDYLYISDQWKIVDNSLLKERVSLMYVARVKPVTLRFFGALCSHTLSKFVGPSIPHFSVSWAHSRWLEGWFLLENWIPHLWAVLS